MKASEPMRAEEALLVLAERREPRQVVITNQGSAREWPKLSRSPLDFHFIPSCMGGAVSLGLGLALARPDLPVLVISGDGSLLMNLGCLVTTAAARAANLTIAVLDNGVYEITGGQRTAGAAAGVDYAALARAAGFRSAQRFSQLPLWRRGASAALAQPGPRLVWLEVEPVRQNYQLDPPCPIREQLDRFRAALEASR